MIGFALSTLPASAARLWWPPTSRAGLSAQTGRAAKDAVRADLTVTMIVPKPGLAAGDGAAHCGRVVVAPIAYIEPLV